MTENRGFHLEIWVLGEKEIHYHDTDLSRFTEKSEEIITDFLRENGVDKDHADSDYAQNINIKWYTV